MESSRFLGNQWLDVNDTDSSWLALKKDKDYLKSKRLDHLSKEQLKERGEQEPQRSHKTSLSFNAGAPGLYSSRQLTTTINFDTNPKKHFHKQNIQPRSSSRIMQSLSSILKHQAASIAATRTRQPLYNKSEMGLHFAGA